VNQRYCCGWLVAAAGCCVVRVRVRPCGVRVRGWASPPSPPPTLDSAHSQPTGRAGTILGQKSGFAAGNLLYGSEAAHELHTRIRGTAVMIRIVIDCK
jgi:hypothetical protein